MSDGQSWWSVHRFVRTTTPPPYLNDHIYDITKILRVKNGDESVKLPDFDWGGEEGVVYPADSNLDMETGRPWITNPLRARPIHASGSAERKLEL